MKTRFCGVVLALGVIAWPASAQQATPVWQPHVDLEAKPGSKRDIGEADFFMPLMQDGKSLLFGNARLRVADQDNREGNFGLGHRQMLEGGWNLGGYGYFDRRRSTTGNYFSQVTLGAEALGRDFDFRGNVYLPQGDRVRDMGTTTVSGGTSSAAIIGTTIQVTTPGATTFTSEERALKGYDLEAGWRLPMWAAEADKQLRVYAGGYYFSDAGIRVSGPRVRAELTMAELPALWKGAQLILGVEYQDDNARGGQGFVSARLRIPLGSGKAADQKMNWQQRRMAAPVVRDVDVVTQARSVLTATAPATVETATATAGGQAITILDSGTTTGVALPGAVAGAGTNSVVLLSGTFNTTAPVTMQSGQTLMGAGTLTVTTPRGMTATLTAPGATINGGGAGGLANATVLPANNSTLTGMNISKVSTAGTAGLGVVVNGVSGATIENNTISGTETGANSSQGLLIFGGSSNIMVRNNNLSAVGHAGGINSIAFNLVNSSATVVGNTMSPTGGTDIRYVQLNSGTVLPGSTGNVAGLGICSLSGINSGSIVFTNAPDCGP